MIDKPDPAKDAGRSDAAGAKRPHATLDLKATEVKPTTSETPPTGDKSALGASTAKPAATAASSSSASAASTGASPEAKASSATSPGGKPTGSADASSKPSQPGSASKPEAAPKPAAAKVPVPASSGGGFLSHLAAGVIGGALVYAGAAFLGPDWLPTANNQSISSLATRISALEQAPRESADTAAIDAKLGDAEARLAKLDELERNVAALSEAQRALEAETKSLSAAAQQGDAAATGERLSKLEEQLRLIASGSGEASGGTQNLAAVTTKIGDVESAVASARQAAEAATLRLERELSQLRTDQARNAQRVDTSRADVDRIAASVEAVKEETARLSSSLGELKSSVESQLKSFAKPGDVTAAVGPVNSKLAELEQNVQTVVQSEQTRRKDAERIVLSLELSNLKRALDRGQGSGYAAELEEVRKVSAGQLDLAPLERFKDTGVATLPELQAEFRPLINAVLDADVEPADGSVLDRLLAGAKTVVRVRKVSHDANDTSTEATVSRIEAALDAGRLNDVITQANVLPQRARIPIEDWLIKVSVRDTVDRAIADVEGSLKASLSGAPAPAPAPVQN